MPDFWQQVQSQIDAALAVPQPDGAQNIPSDCPLFIRLLREDDDDWGCTCGLTAVNPTTIDPPERKTNPWCPVHGSRDPDVERERQIDREMNRSNEE